MARVTYGSIVTELKGKVGGTVFQSNKYGFTAKNTPNMIRPNTQAMFNVRNLFVQAVRKWGSLSQSQRDLFDSYASSFPQYSKNNPTAVLNGYNVTTRWWISLLLGGFGFDLVPEMSVIAFPVLTPSLYIDTGELKLALNGDISSEFARYTCSLSSIVPGSRNFPPSSFRIVYTFEDLAGPADLSAIYTGIFGRDPIPGEFVFLKVSMFSLVNPQVLADQFYKLEVTSI